MVTTLGSVCVQPTGQWHQALTGLKLQVPGKRAGAAVGGGGPDGGRVRHAASRVQGGQAWEVLRPDRPGVIAPHTSPQ